MLLFGHPFIASERFYHVEDVDMIFHTPSNSTLYAEFNEASLELFEHMQKNSLNYAVKVADVEELIYAESLGATYIIVGSDLAKNGQKIAENYLFDAKILVEIEDKKEIEVMAYEGIDGVIFPNAIIHVNS
ncbi:MAG: hypothetical protein U9P71_08270 [Campylobacterota bacterium]|nr:hypothetical protein [Campylobacterota bacterium]